MIAFQKMGQDLGKRTKLDAIWNPFQGRIIGRVNKRYQHQITYYTRNYVISIVFEEKTK